jgi:hypothetical protein
LKPKKFLSFGRNNQIAEKKKELNPIYGIGINIDDGDEF